MLLEDNPNEFEQVADCAENCLSDVVISGKLKVAINQLHVCLSEVATLGFTDRGALPKLVVNQIAKMAMVDQ